MGGKSKSKYTVLAFALVLLLPILASAIYIDQGSPVYLALHGAYDYIRSFTAMDSGGIRNSTLTGWVCTALNCTFSIYLDNDNYTAKSSFVTVRNIKNATVMYNTSEGWKGLSSLNGLGRGQWNYSNVARGYTADYSTVLLLHFDEGTGTTAADSSGNGNNGTLGNATASTRPAWTTGKVNGGLQFDGVDDFVNVSGSLLNGVSSLTMGSWVKMNGASDVTFINAVHPDEIYRFGRESQKFSCLVETSNANYKVYRTDTNYMDNNWHYVSCIWSGGDNFKIYVDGVQQTISSAGSSGTIGQTITLSTNYTVIGKYWRPSGDSWFFNGTIDEVKILNRSLSADEVRAEYENGISSHTNINYELAGGDGYDYGVRDANVNGSYWLDENGTSLDTGLVGDWHMEEGAPSSAVNDSSGFNNHGTYKGSSLQFDGVNDYVNVTSPIGLPFGNTSRTIELWIKPNKVSGYNTLVDYGTWGVIGQESSVYVYNNKVLYTGYGADVFGNTVLLTGTWYHVVVTYNGTYSTIYLNGVFDASADQSLNTVDWGKGLFFGKETFSNTNPFSGTIDEVRIYNRSLSASEVKEHYQGIYSNDTGIVGLWRMKEGAGTSVADDSGMGNTGTIYNGTTACANPPTPGAGCPAWSTDAAPLWTTGRYGSGLNFNGVDKYVRKANMNIGNQQKRTIAAWVKPAQLAKQTIVSFSADTNDYKWQRFFAQSNKIYVVFGDGTASYTEAGNTADAVIANPNEWYFAAVTIDVTKPAGNRINIYVNGEPKAITYTADTGNNLYDGTDLNLYLGAENLGQTPAITDLFNGSIDEVKIFSRALSSNEIKQLYEQSRMKFSNDFLTVKAADLVNITNSTGGALFSDFVPSHTLDGLPLRTTYRANDTKAYFYDWASQSWRLWQKGYGEDKRLSGIVGWWKFNSVNSTNYTLDESGYGNDGRLGNANAGTQPALAAGKYGNGLQFDGVNDYVESNNFTNTNPLTIELWYYASSIPSVSNFIGKTGQNPNGGVFDWYNGHSSACGNSGKFTLYFYTTGWSYFCSNGAYQVGQWYHLVGVVNNNVVNFYINGVLDTTYTYASNINTVSSPLVLGYSKWNNNHYFNGTIDNVKIYNRALSADEVRAEYESSNMPDWNDPRNRQEFKWQQRFSRQFYPSLNITYLLTAADPFVRTFVDAAGKYGELSSSEANDATLVGYWKLNSVNGTNYTADSSRYGNNGQFSTGGSSVTPVAGKIGNGLQFDGVDDYVDAGDKDIFEPHSGSFTIEAWVYPKSTGGRFYWKNGGSPPPFWGVYLMMGGTTGNPTFAGGFGDGTNSVEASVGASLNTWQHVAMVRDKTNGTVRVYTNGVAGSPATDNSNNVYFATSLKIGGRPGTSEMFNGTIDEVRIYNRSLSADEIRENYYRGGASHNITIPITLGQEKSFVQFKSGANVSDTTDSDKYTRFNSSQLQNGTSLLLDGKASGIWHFDEGSGNITADGSGNGNDGTMYGGMNTTVDANLSSGRISAGKFGNALVFDGTDDYVNVTNEQNFDFEYNQPFGLELWLKIPSIPSGTQQLISKFTESPSSKGWETRIQALDSGEYNFMFYMDSANAGEWLTIWADKNISTLAGDNIFHQFVLAYGGSGTTSGINIYIDGELQTKKTNNGADITSSILNDVNALIGRYSYSATAYFNGTIDEARIYPRALSAGEIKEHYQSRVAEKLNPVTTFYDNSSSEEVLFSTQNRISQTARQKIENTSSAKFNRLTYEYDFDVKNNNFLYALGYTTQTATTSGNPSNWTIGFSNETLEAVANSTLTYYDLKDDSLVGWWKMNEGGGNTTADSSGWGNAGTLTNMNTSGNNMNGTIPSGWTSGKYGNGLGFDGANDFVETGINTALNIQSLTVSAWFQYATTGDNRIIVSKTGTGGMHWFLGGSSGACYAGSTIRFGIFSAGTGWGCVDSGFTPTINTMYYVTGLYTGSNLKIYINGVLYGNVVSAKTIYSGNDKIDIGKGNTEYFNGSIDNVKIYSRALSADEIKSDYLAAKDDYPNWAKAETAGGAEHSVTPSFSYDGGAAGIWKFDEGSGSVASDASGNGNTGNLTNFGYDATSGWTTGKYGNGLQFDGVNDYVNIFPTSLGGVNGTIEAWIKTNSFGGANCNLHNGLSNCRAIVSGMSSSVPNDYGYFFGVNNDGALILDTDDDGAVPWATIHNTQPNLIPLNVWSHVVVTTGDGGNNIKYYVNGELKNSSTISTYVGLKIGSYNRSGIGGMVSQPTNQPFNGTIDEVRIYPRALTAGEVKEHYQKEASKYYDDFNTGASKIYGIENSTTNFSAPIDSSTVLALKFDEASGNQTFDSSRFGNTGTMYGGMNTTLDANLSSGRVSAGKFGNGMVFDGVDDSVGASSSSIESGSQMTIALWTKPGIQANNDHTDIIRACAGGGYWGISTETGFNTSNMIRFQVGWVFGSDRWWQPSGTVAVKDEWNQLVLILNRGTGNISFYRNGQFVAQTNEVVGTKPASVGFEIGYCAANHFNGTIDDVRIYNRALSAEEIKSHYEGGVKRYSNGNLRKIVNLNDFYSAQYPAYNLSDTDTAAQQDYDQRLIMVSGMPQDAPDVALNSPADNSWSATRAVNFYFTVSNATGGVANCSLRTNEGGGWTTNANTTAISDGVQASITRAFSSDGNYLWNVECYDAFGNYGTASANRTVKVDATNNFAAGVSANPPTTAGIVQAGAANQLFNFSINNTDTNQNITKVKITLPSGFTYVSGSNGTSAAGTILGNWTPAGESQNLWQYRKSITINGSTAEQANYPVLVNITSSNFDFSKANAQGNDTRFTWLNTTSGLEQNVSFWIENWTSSNALMWVKAPNITASSVANTTLYMYYGNPSATYNNSLGGNSTFEFFDDFEGASLDTSKWEAGSPGDITKYTVSNSILSATSTTANYLDGKTDFNPYNIILESKLKAPEVDNTVPLSIGTGIYAAKFQYYGSYGGAIWIVGGPEQYEARTTLYSGEYSIAGIHAVNSTTVKYYKNYIEVKSFTFGTAITPNNLESPSLFHQNAVSTSYWDWVRVRKYASPEPSMLSVGAEQQNGLTWSNLTSSGIIANGTTRYFWFNASVPTTPANYSFNITVLDTAGVLNSTLVNVSVKAITFTESLSSTVVNPSDSVTVLGQATLEPDGTGVANNAMNVFLDGTLSTSFTPAGESQALWQYRRAITINGSATEQANYQVLVNLTSPGFDFSKANPQGNDTRFTWLNTTSGLEQNISFWIENWTSSGSLGNATLWVKVPNVTASTVANATLYLYYGNPSATYNNSQGGANTFGFFDDFDGGSIDVANKWDTPGANWSIDSGRIKVNLTTTGTSSQITAKTYSFPSTGVLEGKIYLAGITSTDVLYIFPRYSDSANQMYGNFQYNNGADRRRYISVQEGGSWTTDYTGCSQLNNDGWYNFKWTESPSGTYTWDTRMVDGSASCVFSKTDPVGYTGKLAFAASTHPSGDGSVAAYFDDIRVRSYASPEPSVLSIGAEQATMTYPTGGYSYAFTAPSTAGTHTVKINLTDTNGIVGTNTTTFDVRTLVFDQFNLSDRDGQLNGVLNPGEAYNITVRIQETNSTLNYTVSSGAFNVTVSGTNYPLYYTGSNSVWRTNTTALTASSSLGTQSFLANFTGTSGNGISNVTQMNNNYTYSVKQLNITYAVLDSAIYASETAIINGTVYREPEHAASVGTPVQGSVNSGSLTTSSWWNTSWAYRKAITINGSTAEQANYQVNILINSSNVGGNFNWSTYGNDTRFTWLNTTSNSEQNISFWIEYWNNATAGNNASLWVKVPNITASSVANTTVYMYYGNPSATYNNSLGGNSTFLLFDDFNSQSSIDTTKWIETAGTTVSGGELVLSGTTYIHSKVTVLENASIRSKLKVPITGANDGGILSFTNYSGGRPLIGATPSGFSLVTSMAYGNGDEYLDYQNNTASASYNGELTVSWSDPTKYSVIEVFWKRGYIAVRQNDSLLGSVTSDAEIPAGSPLNITLGQTTEHSSTYDWILARRWVTPEPSMLSVGAEQAASATNSQGAYSITYAPNSSIATITSVNFTLNATDTDGITNTTRSPQGAITVYPQIAVDTWASTTSACSGRISDFNNSGAIFLCANVTYGSVAGIGGENVRFAVYKNGINNERSQNPVFNVTGTTTAINFTPAGESQAAWQYRKALTINGSTSLLNDYQIPLNLTTALYNNTGLVGSWHFNNNDTSDSSGYGNNGVQYGGVNCTAMGMFGGGCGFDGSNDYVTSSTTGFPVGNNARTIEAWIKTPTSYLPPANQIILSYGSLAGDQATFLYVTSTGTFDMGFYGDDLSSGISVTDGNWHQILFTFDGSLVRTYVDGAAGATKAATTSTASGTTLYIGQIGLASQYFNGSIDEVRIYNRALSAAEIAEHYSAGKSRLDYQDLRFTWLNSTSNAEQNASYWLESDNQAWVKVPNITASSVANTTMYMYYGNPSATYNNSLGGNNTFEFFDDFNNRNAWTDVGNPTVTVASNTIAVQADGSGQDNIYRMLPLTDNYAMDFGFQINTAVAYPFGHIKSDVNNVGGNLYADYFNSPNRLRITQGSSYWEWTYTLNEWHTLSYAQNGTTGRIFFDYGEVLSGTSTVYSPSYMRLGGTVGNNYASKQTYRNFRVRKYSSPEPSTLSVGAEETPAAGVAYTSFTPNESSQYSLNATAWNANINPSVTATDSHLFEFGQLNISSVNYDTAIYTTEAAVVSGLIRDFMNSSWLNNATATNVTISATQGTFNANWALVNSTGGFNFTYTPPALTSPGSATITINASYGNITGGWSGTISITPAIAVDTWATNASCASRPSAIAEVPTVLNDTGLVGYWKFNSVNASNYTADSSGMNNNGQVLGGAALTPGGKFGAGMQFDGADDYIRIPDNPNLNPNSQITLEGWFKSDSDTQDQNIIHKSYTSHTAPYYQYVLFFQRSGARPGPADLNFNLAINGVAQGVSVVNALPAGERNWHHYVGTYDGSTMRIYVDGVLRNNLSVSGSISSYATPVDMGRYTNVANAEYWTNGIIDEVRIYNRSLSADEISQLYNRTALSLCANVTYGQNKTAGAYVNLTVNRTGSSYYGANPANTITNLYDTGTVVSTEITPDESTKYTVTAKAWNPDVSSAVASGTYDYTYGKINTTIALNDTAIYTNENALVSGKVFDWLNESWVRTLGNYTPAGESQALWPYRKAITINGSTAEQANYQILVNLTSSNFNFSKANSQGNDTRFTWLNTTSGQEQNISFWIENWTSSGSLGNATLWVRVPNVTASTVANTTLYMYYGNPAATSASNSTNTFDFFDDFEGQTVGNAPSGWTTSGTVQISDTQKYSGSLSQKQVTLSDAYKSVSFASNLMFELWGWTSGTGNIGDVRIRSGSNTVLRFGFDNIGQFIYNDGSYHYGPAFSASTWYKFRVDNFNYATNTAHLLITNSAGTTIWDTNTGIYNYDTFDNIYLLAAQAGTTYFDYIKARKYASPEPNVLSVGSEETHDGATVYLSAAGGTILSNVSTNSTGGYSTTYTPPPVTSIQNYTIHANATDADGLNSSAVSTQIKVYPALSKLNASIYTDRTYYNVGENVTIGTVFRNNETGGLLSGALLRAKIYRNDTGSQAGSDTNLPERAGYFAGSYLANFSTSGLTEGWHYVNITSEADYNVALPGSGKLFYVNNFTSTMPVTNETLVQADIFRRKNDIGVQISITSPSPPVNSSIYLMNSSGTVENSTLLDVVIGSSLDRKVLHTLPGEVSGGYWRINSSTINGNGKYSHLEKDIFVRHLWWDSDTISSEYWEKRVRITLDNRLSPAQANSLVSLNGSELEAAGANLSLVQAGSIRVVDPDAPVQGNEINGHPVPYNITNTSSLGAGDRVSFLANASENSRKTYYVYFSYLTSMATASISLDTSGAKYPAEAGQIESANLKVTRVVTDKEIYDFGEPIYINASIYTPDKPNTAVKSKARNSTGAYVSPTIVSLSDPDGDYVYVTPSGRSTTGKEAYGYGTWTLEIIATQDDGLGTTVDEDILYKDVFLEATNASINAPAFIYANDSLAVSGNITYKASGLNASGANLTIYVEKGAYVQASYTMNADENGSYSHTFPALDVPGDFSVRVVSNHTVPQGLARGTNTKALEIRHKVDQSNVAPAKSWFPEEIVWVNTSAKTYSDASEEAENLAATINITNSSGAVVGTLSGNIAFATPFANKTIETVWNISGRPVGEYNITTTLTSQNTHDDAVKAVNQTLFTFYRLNVTAGTSVPSLMTGQWVNITGIVAYPNGTAKGCPVYISMRGTNDANGESWSKNITDVSVNGQYDNYTKADVPGNFIIYATCHGTNEKGYAAAPLEVNLSATVVVAANAPSYKANTPAYITVNVTNDAETTVNNYVVENRIVNSTGTFIEYASPKNWTIASLGSLAKNSTQTMWNTSHWAPGNYTAITDVYVSGKKIGSGNRTFEVNTTIEANAFALNINTTSLGLKADLGISGWINRTGNVVVNGTMDIYVKDYTGARVLDIAYPGEAANPGKDYVRLYNTTAYQNSPANFTNILEYNYSALWNSWHFHNGTYTAYGNFTYYDEYGALKSSSASKTFTIPPVWSASVWFGSPPNGSSYGSGQTFALWAYMNNTGNIEICDGSQECPVKIWSELPDGTNLKAIFGQVGAYGSPQYVSAINILGGSQIGGHPAVDHSLPGQFPPSSIWYSGAHIIYINQTLDGSQLLQNTTTVIIGAQDSNLTLTLLGSYIKETSPNIYYGYDLVPFDINANIQLSPKWSTIGNVKKYNLTQELSILNYYTLALVKQVNRTFDLDPGSSSAVINTENWQNGITPNGTYILRTKLYNLTGQIPFLCSTGDYTCDSASLELQEDETFSIAAVKNATITANTTNSSYNSYEDVNISGFVNNTGNVPGITGYLNLSVFGPSGYYDNLSSCGNATFPIGSNYNCTWNTGMRENGTYTVNATYNYGSGTASASKAFTISPYTRAGTSTWTDKSAYNQSENVNISANITNIGNALVSGNITIKVKYGGSTIATINQTNAISVPVAGVHSSWGNAWNTGASQYGSYDVVSDFAYLDENNTARTATSTRTITVNENRSITLSMDTDKASYKSNWGVNITVDLNNTGNAVLNGASLVYTIKQGATPVATYTDNLVDSTVSIGEYYKRSWLWNASTYAAGTYTVEAKVADSTLASWARTKDIQVNATRTASIAGLSVDVMPPSNYNPGNTIYVYGTVNATGNVQFAGNLSLRYYNKRLVADKYYDNRTGISTGSGMNALAPPATASATTIDVGVINLTATYSWIDEDNIARTAWSNVTFYIGGTSVSVSTGATNTYNPDDAVPLSVHVAGMSGNLTGLTSGNFTITDGTDTYAPPMAEQGNGDYLFTFPASTFEIGDYAIRVTATDPDTGIPGTGTANLYIRDHWITVRVDANSALASSEADAGQGYAAAKSGQALVALVQRGGALDSLSATANSLVMKQKLTANRFNLVMTQGSVKENIRDRIKLIVSGEFEKYASPSFGFALAKEYHVSVSRIYDAIDLIGVNVGTFRPGMYNLIIKNDGASNGKTKIAVSRK